MVFVSKKIEKGTGESGGGFDHLAFARRKVQYFRLAGFVQGSATKHDSSACQHFTGEMQS